MARTTTKTAKTTKTSAPATRPENAIPYALATPDPEPPKAVPCEFPQPRVEPWPSAEFRKAVLETLYAIHWTTHGVVKIDEVRGLMHVRVTNGPAAVCTRAEWDAIRVDAIVRQAQLKGTYGADVEKLRPLRPYDVEELADAAVDRRLDADALAWLIGASGGTLADGAVVAHGGRVLVRASASGSSHELYLLEDVGDGSVRVRRIGQQIGCWVVPNLQTTTPDVDGDEELVPAYDDAEAIAAEELADTAARAKGAA
ncbi:MAG: hypothetical protein HYV09_35815 [Deltaproteobacteria bacterium]|nr:hypothetical protein [Deltaproteobacteria bacterium]